MYSLTLLDEQDELGLRQAGIDVTVDYDVDPGDPGCYRTRNGDGWPETPPTVDLVRFTVDRVYSVGLPHPLTPQLLEVVRAWVDDELTRRWAGIERDILDRHHEPSPDDLADLATEDY